MYRNSLKAFRATCLHGLPFCCFKKVELCGWDVWMVQPRHSSPSAWSTIRDLMYWCTWKKLEGLQKHLENLEKNMLESWINNKNKCRSLATKRPCCCWSAGIDLPRCEHPTWVHLVKTDPVIWEILANSQNFEPFPCLRKVFLLLSITPFTLCKQSQG